MARSRLDSLPESIPMSNSESQQRTTRPKLLDPNIVAGNLYRKNIQQDLGIQADSTPDRIIERLVRGNNQHIEMRSQNISTNAYSLSAVAQGKTPYAAVVNYTRSTLAIEDIFGLKFGELFVINSPDRLPSIKEISAIEASVIISGVRVIILLSDELDERAIERYKYLKLDLKSHNIAIADRILLDPKTNLSLRIAKLKDSPLLSRSIQAGNIKVIGGLHNADRGTVEILAA